MTATLQTPWKVLVLVHAPDSDASCVARLSFIHDQTANQASILLSITTTLANSRSQAQIYYLSIPPDRVKTCTLARKSNDSLCPAPLLPLHPAPVTRVSAVSTLTLDLKEVGIVYGPSGVGSLKPATLGDLKLLQLFAIICQSTSLRLHFTNRQFKNDELDKLQSFSAALQRRGLQAAPFDTARHHVCKIDCSVFGLSPDPPPYSESEQVDPPLHYGQVVGKRQRGPWSPDNQGRKRPHLPPSQLIGSPPGSPTEVNTPSTGASRSPASIRPTHFQPPAPSDQTDQTEHKTLAHLERELRGVSDDLIRKLLIQSGREYLLARPEDVDRRLAHKLEPVGSSPVVDMMIKRQFEKYFNEIIKCQLEKCVVESGNQAYDQANDLCSQKEYEFNDLIDERKVEVRAEADECIEELKRDLQGYMEEMAQQFKGHMEEMAQQFEGHMEEMAQQFQGYMGRIKNRGIEIGPKISAQSSFNGKPNVGSLGVRCSSV